MFLRQDEAEAYAAGWQLDAWRGVAHPSPRDQARSLVGYVLSGEARVAAEAALESYAATLAAGGRVSGVASFAASVLPVELRG